MTYFLEAFIELWERTSRKPTKAASNSGQIHKIIDYLAGVASRDRAAATVLELMLPPLQQVYQNKLYKRSLIKPPNCVANLMLNLLAKNKYGFPQVG